MKNALWDFSLKVYAAPDVADECLRLQNEFGVNINLVLFVTYVGTMALTLSFDEARQCAALVREWHEQITKPLRQVRITLKCAGCRPASDQNEVEYIRTNTKAVELESERFEQKILYQWFTKCKLRPSSDGAEDAIHKNISTLFSALAMEGAKLPQQLILAGLSYASATEA